MSVELWHDWNASGRPRAKLSPILKAYQPYIGREVDRWSGSGLSPLLLRSEASRLAIGAIKTYDPSRAQLQTHLVTALKGLDRFVNTYRDDVRLPLEKAQLAGKVYQARQELESELGREATASEIATRAGVGQTSLGHLKRYQASLYSVLGEAGAGQPVRGDIDHQQLAADFLFQSLSPQQQLVFGYSTGYGGKPQLGNNAIAGKLGVSATRVSGLRREILTQAQRYQGAVSSLMEA